MSKCLVCRNPSVTEYLNVGAHPIASGLLSDPTKNAKSYPLALGRCSTCGTIQLMAPLPYTALVPPFDWMVFREPESHLDTVVEQIVGLHGIDPESVISGVSSKDTSTLDRFRARGFTNVWGLELERDYGATDPIAHIETVQHRLTPERMRKVAADRGPIDCLFVRHILEHAENPTEFVQGLGVLVRPRGYVIVEVPDCTANLRGPDYTMIWEEHTLYFTAETFRGILHIGGFEPVSLESYPYPYENSLVLVARKLEVGRSAPREPATADSSESLIRHYAAGMEETTRALRAFFEKHRSDGGEIALYGAGHLTCAFVNYHGLGELISFVTDDTAQKQGLFLPGSKLPIVPGSRLAESGVTLCLLGLAPENENKVIAKNQSYVDRDGAFRSIFRASERAVQALL